MPSSTRRKPSARKNPPGMLAVGEVIRALERRAPQATAEEWDNVGLLAGDPRWVTAHAVVTIDLSPLALEAARASRSRLIVTHHPCLFPRSGGANRLVPGKGPALTSTVLDAFASGIAVASLHTNFDRCALEVVERVSRGLGAVPKGRLFERRAEADQLRKLVVFVPETHGERVREALCAAGAGHIGAYDSCTFAVAGEGTFRGSSSTRPFLGEPGRLERVRELRLETVYPKGIESAVIDALLMSHPYEEVAYDSYLVEQPASNSRRGIVKGMGYGFWGDLGSPRAFSALAKRVKRLFNIDGFLLTEKGRERGQNFQNLKMSRVAFVAGKGAGFVGAAAEAGCDLFITGEVGYHGALEGSRRGMSIMEIGHRESELFFVETMKQWISDLKLSPVVVNAPTQRFTV